MRTGLFIAGASIFLAVAIMTLVPNVLGQAEVDVGIQSRLTDLLTQRRDTLTKAVELRRQQYLNGNCGFEVVLATLQHLHEAELEAATTREDRVAALTKQLEVAESAVARAEQMFKDGRVNSVDILSRSTRKSRRYPKLRYRSQITRRRLT